MLVLYKNICRSLFGKDKLIFSFLLCSRVLIADDDLDAGQLRLFLAGSTNMSAEQLNPVGEGSWLTDNAWKNPEALSSF